MTNYTVTMVSPPYESPGHGHVITCTVTESREAIVRLGEQAQSEEGMAEVVKIDRTNWPDAEVTLRVRGDFSLANGSTLALGM